MLQQEAVQSAQIYLDYLTAHRDMGLGLVRARVLSIQSSMLSEEMILFTDRVMRSGDNLVIRINGTLYENSTDTEHFRIRSISRRKVYIIPSPELGEHIESAWEHGDLIFLEADLTFLVKRVKNWYEKYGKKIELPSVIPGASGCTLLPDNPIMLSDSQYDCASLAMSSPLTYVWGAPGTGKTKHVLASCVLSHIRAKKKVILVAPTNNALEQSLGGLLRVLFREGGIHPAGKVIRLGVPGEVFHTVWPDVCEDGALSWFMTKITDKINFLKNQNRLIDESIVVRGGKGSEGDMDFFPDKDNEWLKKEKKKNINQINDLFSKSRKLTEKGIMQMISSFSVVAATVDTCLFRISPDGAFNPDHVFLDEAGYCNVIKGMTLLGFGKPLTLLGDHMQLPPVFEGEQEFLNGPENQLARLWKISSLYMENAVSGGKLSELCNHDPDRPLFDRMQVGALRETYRFGPKLTEILARRIYGSKFCSRSENETKIVYINAPKTDADREKDNEGKHRRISHGEAKCIRTLIEMNLNHPGLTVGIITPYRKQRRLLSDTIDRLLKKYRIADEDMEDDIVTVHQSQGREWDVVIFSITDCFDEMFFTNSRKAEALKLINTAISRAKKMLVLVGDADSWKGKYGQMISELFAVGQEISHRDKIMESIQEGQEV